MAWFKKASSKNQEQENFSSTYNALIRKLSNDDRHIIQNVKKIILGKGEAVIPFLVENLNHPNSSIRKNCAELIGELGGPNEVAILT